MVQRINKKKSCHKNMNTSDYSMNIQNRSTSKLNKVNFIIDIAAFDTKHKNSSVENLFEKNKTEISKGRSNGKKEEKKYKLEDFIVISLLGFGTFGSVLLVTLPQDPTPYALKVVKKAKLDLYKNKKQVEHIKNEKLVLQKIKNC